jgi:hypothetical protein
MAHGTIRAATLKTIIPLIMEQFNCEENEAFKMFYESHVGKCYSDDSTGLYGQSAVYVFSLFYDEMNGYPRPAPLSTNPVSG